MAVWTKLANYSKKKQEFLLSNIVGVSPPLKTARLTHTSSKAEPNTNNGCFRCTVRENKNQPSRNYACNVSS